MCSLSQGKVVYREKNIVVNIFGPSLEGGVSLGHKPSIINTKADKWCYNISVLIAIER